LTEGSVEIWAICLECDRRGGRSLAGAWGGLVLWLGGILLVLFLATVALGWLVR
jgi:hypothetical protein